MPVSEAHKKAQKKYDKENSVSIGLKLNRKSDKDILEWLEGKTKQAAIKDAIRTVMKMEQEQNNTNEEPRHE